MDRPTLYLMVGYPGSGKTTISKIIHQQTGAVHIWADHERNKMFVHPKHDHDENIKLYAELNIKTRQLLHEGKSVIFDTNFNFYKDRKKLRIIAAKEGAQTVVVWVTTSIDVSRSRATEQSHNKETRVWGNMPLEHFERISCNLQPPLEGERPIKFDGTNLDPQTVIDALKKLDS
ncbi:MAG TPA: ATP-binding protein [Patescibacteria group bacterium]|nr:ATP-binding protein [Patescibacteria group bacterium]